MFMRNERHGWQVSADLSHKIYPNSPTLTQCLDPFHGRTVWLVKTGGNDINDGCIPFRWDSSRALVACRLTHWHGLLGHRIKRNHWTLLSHVEFNDTSDILIICHSNISLFLMTLILHYALQIDFWMESPLTSPPTALYLNGQWDRAGGALVWWGQWGKFRTGIGPSSLSGHVHPSIRVGDADL